MAWWSWSTTSASNGGADPTINFAEGQSPSSVNNSARALMARTADYRDLVSGRIATTGSGTALVLSSGQTPVFDTTAHMDGQMVAFTPNVTNTGPVTLAVDGLAAKPIRSQPGSSGNLGAGVLVQGTPYVCTYYDSAGEFILQGFVGQTNAVPVGCFLFGSFPTVPNSNFIMPIGQAISRTTYAVLFGITGTYYGIGDGSTTFNVPDLRSRILVPLATMGGSDPGIVTFAGSGVEGDQTGAVGGAQNVTLTTPQTPSHTHTFTGNALPAHSHANSESASASMFNGGNNVMLPIGSSNTSSVSAGTPTGSNSNTGGDQFHNNMPPCIVLPVFLRIL